MRLRLLVAARAERQIREAADWWRENRLAAPELLHQKLARAFELITTQPGIGPEARDVDLAGVRRLLPLRVQHWLYDRERTGDRVQVLALWHTSRAKGPRLR